MRTRTEVRILLGVALSIFVLWGSAAGAQTKSGTEKEYESLIYSVKGPDLFRAHCAACHGLDGKGSGPVAPSLKVKPADLTLLAKRSGGRFSEARVRSFISGDEPTLSSHGTREMPVWG